MNRVGIFGTSGMAREVGDIAISLGIEPIYVARDGIELGEWNLPAQVILEQDLGQYHGIPFVIGIGDGNVRKAVAGRFRDRLKFTNLIHPTATFGASQRDVLEKSIGTVVAAGVRLTNGISIGDFCIFNQNATVAHDCVVGNFVHVAPGANVSGNVHLQDGCWIGAGAIVNQGNPGNKLRIGENTIVGSGAAVISDCNPNAVYVGVPARRVK